MPAIQTTYSENIPKAVAGAMADMRAKTLASRDVEPVGGIGFGVAVFQGTADKQIILKAAGATEVASDFVGITVRDRSVRTGDAYVQRESARVMQQGAIWVNAAVQVAAGDPVAVTSAGVFSNVAGTNGVVLANARWDTSTTGTNQLAVVALK